MMPGRSHVLLGHDWAEEDDGWGVYIVRLEDVYQRVGRWLWCLYTGNRER